MIAVNKLRSCGYKRIGFFLSELVHERSEGNFLGGFLVEQKRLAADDRIPVFMTPGEPADRERKRFTRWFRAHRPDVILADFAEWAVGFLQAIDLRVPDNIPLAILAALPGRSRYAGVDQNDVKVGRLAVDTVVGMLYRNETGVPVTPTRILVEGQWQSGESLPEGSDFTSVSGKHVVSILR
jgi:LacI family transcriptional regulator